MFPRQRAWLTEQRIRRRAGGARGTQQSHSPARARGTGAGGRRGGGGREGGGCSQLLPHSPRRRRPAGHRRLGLAAGRRTPFALLMSLSAGCWRRVQAAQSSRGGAPGLLMPRTGARREDRGEAARRERERERESESARNCAPRGPGRPTHRAAAPCAARPAGHRAPETLAHVLSGGRGGGSRPTRCAPPVTAPPRPWPRGAAYQPRWRPRRWGAHPASGRAAGKEAGAGCVGVPAGEGHASGGARRRLRHPGGGLQARGGGPCAPRRRR